MKILAALLVSTVSMPLWASDQDRIDAFIDVASEVTSFIQATGPTVAACQQALEQAGREGLDWDACQSVMRLSPDVTEAIRRFGQALDQIELVGLEDDPQVLVAARAATRIVRENRIRVAALTGTMAALALGGER